MGTRGRLENAARVIAPLLGVLLASRPVFAAALGIALATLGGSCSGVTSLSSDGAVAVGWAGDFPWDGEGHVVATRWVPGGGVQALGWLPGDVDSYGLDVSADGQVVVGASGSIAGSGRTVRAFRWSAVSGMQPLGWLAGDVQSEATAISPDGAVIVGTSSGASPVRVEPFRWTAEGGMVGLGWLPGHNQARLLDVSADGDVAVGFSVWSESQSVASNATWEAFRWTRAHGMERLFPLAGGRVSKAFGVTPDGRIAVGSSDDRAVRWDPAVGTLALAKLPGTEQCEAREISADGLVMLGVCDDVLARWSPDPSAPARFPVVHRVSSVAALLADVGYDVSAWLRLADPLSGFGRALSADGRWMAGAGQVAADVSLLGAWRASVPSCADGIDNDGDGSADLGGDSDCRSIASDAERLPACSNGVDDDGDGRIDVESDPGCRSATATTESPPCDDRIDNDGDGGIDFAPPPGFVPDPRCVFAWGSESDMACGLVGIEIAPLLVAYALRRSMRRRRSA
jgi:probable HAF family extracellular repeat protein